MPETSSLYARLRSARRSRRLLEPLVDAALHEGGPPPPERWLQQVWRHQRVVRAGLRLADGSPVRILHPGFWNREPGPDFLGAVIQFGDAPARTGDVELDLRTTGWRAHGHAHNDRFADVILHVVWDEADVDRARPPVMALAPFLDAPLPELAHWLDLEAADVLPANVPGSCQASLQALSATSLEALLRQASWVRLERKASELSARARQLGWENALWEGMLAALGYKHNAWAFRHLAGRMPLVPGAPASTGPSTALAAPLHPVALEAQFLGVAGLLPHELSRGADPHLRALWDCWWRERDAWRDDLVPRDLWRLGGIRPANRPERRLALAARWRRDPGLPGRLDAWLEATPGRRPGARLQDLMQVLSPPPDEGDPFWSRHWTLRSGTLPEAHPWLGSPRLTDLAANVILPWAWARCGPGTGRESLRAHVASCWIEWPAGEDNASLRLVRQRLFGTHAPRLPGRAYIQQGLLQVRRDFCDPSGALCRDCRFPTDWVAGRAEAMAPAPPPDAPSPA